MFRDAVVCEILNTQSRFTICVLPRIGHRRFVYERREDGS